MYLFLCSVERFALNMVRFSFVHGDYRLGHVGSWTRFGPPEPKRDGPELIRPGQKLDIAVD